MRLRALGTGTIALTGARVRAGYLVDVGPVRLLMDCGSGVTHRLAELGEDWMGITHVAISHFHADHIADLPTLIFAWKYGALPARAAPVEILGPSGILRVLRGMAQGFGDWVTEPGFPLSIREVAPDVRLELAPGVTLASRKTPHTEESLAWSVEHEGRRIVYTGDTGYDESLAEWARGADVFLMECSLPAEMAIKEHLTPEQCGALAAVARPRRLVLTHLYPPVERVDIRAAVASHFAGEVIIASDGMLIEV